MNTMTYSNKFILDLILSKQNVPEALKEINIERIEDHVTKIICRTITNSEEILLQKLFDSVGGKK